jgi:ABC-2 type transport system permease protein
MFRAVFWFELCFWLRSRLLYSLLLTTTGILFLSMATQLIRFRGPGGIQIRNTALTVQLLYQYLSAAGFLIFASFPIAAATRDHTYQMSEIIFTTSVSRFGWLLGRFTASTIIALIPLCGISAGILIGSVMPWNDPAQFVPICWPAHLLGLAAIAVPNALLPATIAFVISLRIPNAVSVQILLATLWFGTDLGTDLLRIYDHELLAAMLDPFGSIAVFQQTKYLTGAKLQTEYVTLVGYLLWNRVLWLSISALILAVGCRRFQLTPRRNRLAVETHRPVPGHDLRSFALTHSATPAFLNRARQLLNLTRFEFRSAVSGPLFIIISGFVLWTLAFPLLRFETGYGQQSLPVTSAVVEVIAERCRFPTLIFIVVAAGMLVHRERDCRIHEIISTLPHPDWLFCCGRLLAMTLAVAMMLTTGAVMGVFSQLIRGFTNLQPEVYVVSLLGVELLRLFVVAVLVFTVQICTSSRVCGYMLCLGNEIISPYFISQLATNRGLISILHQPSLIYSDFYGFAPYAGGLLAFSIWSLLLCAVLCLLMSLLWQRGNDTAIMTRLREARRRLRGRTAVAAAVICGTTTLYGVWLHTAVTNHWDPNNDPTDAAADYETRFRTRFENKPHPRITDLRYEVDLFPKERSVRIRSTQTLQNRQRFWSTCRQACSTQSVSNRHTCCSICPHCGLRCTALNRHCCRVTASVCTVPPAMMPLRLNLTLNSATSCRMASRSLTSVPPSVTRQTANCRMNRNAVNAVCRNSDRPRHSTRTISRLAEITKIPRTAIWSPWKPLSAPKVTTLQLPRGHCCVHGISRIDSTSTIGWIHQRPKPPWCCRQDSGWPAISVTVSQRRSGTTPITSGMFPA